MAETKSSIFRDFMAEVRKRRVHKVIIAYLAIAWALIEVSSTVFPTLLLPDWSARLVVILAIIGFPVVVLLAWIFDVTPQGVERTPAVLTAHTPKLTRRAPVHPVVGRDAERAQLLEAFKSARDTRGALVGIAGEAGMGKSSLVEDFIANLKSSEHDWLLGCGRSSERFAGTEVYLPLVEALTDMARSDDSGDFAKDLRRLAPSWYAMVFGVGEHAHDDSAPRANSQDRMNRELALLFQHCSRETPIVLFFEDFHWADVSTVDAIVYLADRFEELRLLVLITYRESEVLQGGHPFQQARLNLLSRGLSHEIKLETLGRDEIESMLDIEFPHNRFPDDLPERIYERTGGHPLFAADLLRYLKDSGGIRKDGDVWVLNSSLDEVQKNLPESVRSMVERKMAGVKEEYRNLLSPAALQGYAFDSAVLARVLELEPEVVEEKLEDLERVYALVRLFEERQMPDRTLTSRYEFAHTLYLDYWFNSLRPTRKATMSRTIAQILEDFYGPRTSEIAPELAALYENAKDFEHAARYLLEAVDNAKSVFAYREATEMARKGLQVARSLEPSPERDGQELRFLLSLGGSLCMIKGYASPETIDCFDQALRLTETLEDAAQDADVIWGLWMAYVNTGNCERARELSERLNQLAAQSGDAMLAGAGHYAAAITNEIAGDLQSTMQHLEPLVGAELPGSGKARTKRFVVDPFISARGIHLRLLTLLGYSGQADERWKLCRAAVDSGDLDPRSACDLLIGGCCYNALNRKAEKVLLLAEETVEKCEEFDIFFEREWAEFWRGWALTEVGSPDEGLEKMRAFLTMITSAGTLMHHSFYFATLAEALAKAGQTEEARKLVQDGLALTRRTGQGFFESELHRIGGELESLPGGDTETAKSSLKRAVEITVEQDTRLLEARAGLSLARLLQRGGEQDEAQRVLASTAERMRDGFESPEFSQIQTLLHDWA